MLNNRISNVITTDMTNTVSDYSVIDVDTSINEYVPSWSKYYGYYNAINPLSAMIDRKALWTVGRGYKCDTATSRSLSNIKGFGKDTANTIFYNAVKTYTIGGDFLAEKIKNKRNKLTNLKPLNPGMFKIKASSKGIISEYEQIYPSGNDMKLQTFSPDEVFHLAYNRTADEIHGVGVVQKMENVLLKYQEVMNDIQTVFHRYVKPLIISEIDTDDSTEIAAYKSKLDSAVANGENLIIPKDTATIQRVSIPQFSTLDPLPYIKYLENEFFKSEGVPAIIQGIGGNSTEAEAKIIYLAWQQVVEWNQLFLEEQLKAQLDLNLNFEFPASIAPELLLDSSKSKDINRSSIVNQAKKQ